MDAQSSPSSAKSRARRVVQNLPYNSPTHSYTCITRSSNPTALNHPIQRLRSSHVSPARTHPIRRCLAEITPLAALSRALLPPSSRAAQIDPPPLATATSSSIPQAPPHSPRRCPSLPMLLLPPSPPLQIDAAGETALLPADRVTRRLRRPPQIDVVGAPSRRPRCVAVESRFQIDVVGAPSP